MANLLPLDTWREIMGFHALHFWQVAGNLAPIDGGCNSLVREYNYQYPGGSNYKGAGRSDIRAAIKKAEDILTEYLTYSPAPRWNTETIDVNCFKSGTTLGVILKEGKLIQFGTPGLNILEQVAVIYADKDGDGLQETFTATFTLPAGVNVDDLSLYFINADRPVIRNGDYEIRPIIKSVTAGVVTFTGSAWMLVKPTLYQGFGYRIGYDPGVTGQKDTSGAIDPLNSANFVTTLQVCQSIVTNPGCASLIFNRGGVDEAVTIKAEIYQGDTGRLTLYPFPANWLCFCGSPDWYDYGAGYLRKVEISYQAGAKIEDYENIIARLSAAELMRPICGCDAANLELYNWMADSANPDSKYRPAQNDLASPLGPKRGHVYAWHRIKNLTILRGRRA